MRHAAVVLLLMLLCILPLALTACGDSEESISEYSDDDDDDDFELIESFDPPDASNDDDDGEFDPPDIHLDPPIGENPALGYGPYSVDIYRVRIFDDVRPSSAYAYIPDLGKEGPLPTIVWGHGIWSCDRPIMQREIFLRLATRGFLVVYPNMDVPFPFMDEDTVMKGVGTYLRATRQAVALGIADPDRIVFAGYSFGARVAALATAMTSGMDPLNIWPDPVASVYEALPDLNNQPTHPIQFYGPRPSEWAHYIDPSIDQTVIAAEEDIVVPCYEQGTDLWVNGGHFYEMLETDFAQLIILQSGTGLQDRATHFTFTGPTQKMLNAHDLWGHIKIVNGIMQHRFHGRSKEWAYGVMRSVGGIDSAGNLIFHKVFDRGEQPSLQSPDPEPNPELRSGPQGLD